MQQDSTRRALHGAMSGRAVDGEQGDWRKRLARSMSFPDKRPVTRYLDRVAQPALEQVAEAIRDRGADVELHREPVEELGIDQIDLHIGFGDEKDFRYQIYPVQYPTPSFAGVIHLDSDADRYYYRLEVFTLTGSLGYDIYGYTQEQLISDVLDLYERHMEFLHMQADLPGTSDLSDNADPVREWSDDYAKEDS